MRMLNILILEIKIYIFVLYQNMAYSQFFLGFSQIQISIGLLE